MENRNSRRIDIKAAITVQAEGFKRIHGWVKDVSITGTHVQTDEFLPIGTECLATLVVRDGTERRRIDIPAKVVRHDPEGFGLQFGNMTETIRTALSMVLLQNLPTSG